jgi:hypothetical protein
VGCRKKAEERVDSPPAVAAVNVHSVDPPAIDSGLSVDQAYAAIPHRRTVWDNSSSAIPADEKVYLRNIFQAMDVGVTVRVAALQNFSAGRFDGADPVAQYDQLIEFVRGMAVPGPLAGYHQKILDGFTGQRQLFADWKSQREQFPFAQRIGDHPGARNASNALRAAYGELMAKYPDESPSNKDAFFDYHCALDFL